MKSYHCSAEMHERCANNALCHLCDGTSLFSDPVAERNEKLRVREEKKEALKKAPLKTYKEEKKEGMAFEKRVASQWNQKFSKKEKKKVAKPRIDVDALISDSPQVQAEETPPPTFIGARPKKSVSTSKPEAKRQANSGALWHAKGDIKLEHALLECKERGTTNSRGEKTITIPKLWIEKQEKEAFQEQRPYWYIPFAYKGDPGIYLIKSYDHEMEMIYEIRRLREELEHMKKQMGDSLD